MSRAALLILLAIQASESRLKVTIQCELDTELALEGISVTVEEKRETTSTPQPRGEAGGTVTLRDLPEGDLHLLFYRDMSLLGQVEVKSAENGEFIRLMVRLVEGNAILLNEFRVRGVSELVAETRVTKPDKTKPPTARRQPPPAPTASPDKRASWKPCPPPGEPVTLRGKLIRVIDNDAFELQSGPRTYFVYIGSATRISRQGGSAVGKGALRENQALFVTGTVAAGPEAECSVGAKKIELRR